MRALQALLSRLRAQYDKLIMFVVVVGLLGSLTYLGFHAGMIHHLQAEFFREIDDITPTHPVAAELDEEPYRAADQEIRAPFQMAQADWPRHLLVPETRVWCVDCRRPILIDAEQCPFCRTPQPPDKETLRHYDGDKDGMWDGWERDHGLDARDARDAWLDSDGDGFSNIAEFRADPRTDPSDPKSFPPPEAELRVKEIRAVSFPLRFKSSFTMPDDSLKFQLNVGGGNRTYFKRLGEEIEGFKLETYEPRTRERTDGPIKSPLDVSILTLKRGEKLIPLVRGEQVPYSEFTVKLLFALDGTEYVLKIGGEFELKGSTYRLLSVDSRNESVVIVRLHDDKRLTVRKFPQE